MGPGGGTVPPERFLTIRPIGYDKDRCGNAELAQDRPRLREHAVVAVVEGERREAAQRSAAREALDHFAERHDVVPTREPLYLLRERFDRQVHGGLAQVIRVAGGQHVMVTEHDTCVAPAAHQCR